MIKHLVNSIKKYREKIKKSKIIQVEIDTPSLVEAKLKLPKKQKLYILLPPNYYKDKKNYPVVYYLHGYEGSASIVKSFEKISSSLMQDGSIEEFIIVGVSGRNSLGGSFYVNSSTCGNWQDYIVKDLLTYIDDNYRTIKDASARGISGFSMGGFGALNIAMNYPSIFSYVYAQAPCLFPEGYLGRILYQWRNNKNLQDAYACAFAPKEDYGLIPKFDNSQSDKLTIDRWLSGCGKLKEKVEVYNSKTPKLKSIKIVYGVNDFYFWIPIGCKELSKELNKLKIGHTIESFLGAHEDILGVHLAEKMLPFFSSSFSKHLSSKEF